VLGSLVLVLTPAGMLLAWGAHARRATPSGFWWTKSALLLCCAGVLLIVLGIMNVSERTLGTHNAWTSAIFVGSLLLPVAAAGSLLLSIDAWRRGAGSWFRAYAVAVSLGAVVLALYLSSWDMLAFRSWAY
jgi:hypothetical protein